VINPTEDHLDNCFDAVIIGDVTQNWTPLADDPKAVAYSGDADVEVFAQGKTASITLRGEEIFAVDLATNLRLLSVETNASDWMVEWSASRIAMAGVDPLGTVVLTVTVESMPSALELTGAMNDEPFAVTAKVVPLPVEYSLAQNYPNPFNPVTSIEYALPEAAEVKVEVYNVLGQVIEVLVESGQEAGYYKVEWDATDMASGVYFYRIAANDFTSTKRMILMK
jgi:hypothetical protein